MSLFANKRYIKKSSRNQHVGSFDTNITAEMKKIVKVAFTISPTYADDVAAAAGNVPIGTLYVRDSGEIAIRLT